MLATLDTGTSEYPHQIVRSAHGFEPEGHDNPTVTRSEMILLVVMTLSRMVERRLNEHEIYPVSLASSHHGDFT